MKIELDISEYPEDTKRIQRILAKKGYEASLVECDTMWKEYSKNMAAGWMSLPEKDDEVFEMVSQYFVPKPN